MYAVRPSFRTPHQPLRKGRRAICRVVIEAPIQLGTAPAAVDLDCRFEHYFRYEALAVSIKKGSSGDVLELWTRSPYQTIQYYAAPSPQSGRETLYISAQEGMKPPGINPLTGPHLRILDFHAENRKVTRLRFPVPLSLSKRGKRPFKEVYAYGLW